MKISVLGCGRWGSFIGWHLCNNGHKVIQWGTEGHNSFDVLKNTGKNEYVELDKRIELTITEGKFHQIKRMAHAVDNAVAYLRRLSYGDLYLDETLSEGEYRHLTDEEVTNLYNVYKRKL